MKFKTIFLIKLCPILLIICGLCSSCVMTSQKEARISENVFIDGVDISGMTEKDARAKIKDAHKRMLKAQKYVIVTEDDEVKLSAFELGVSYDFEDALLVALSLDDDTDGEKHEFESTPVLDDEKARAAIKTAAEKLTRDAEDAQAEYSNGEFKFTPEEAGATLNEDELLSDINSALAAPGTKEIEIKTALTESAPDNSAVTIDRLIQDNTLLGEYTTYFNKDPYNAENRVNNIKKAAQLVDGTEVAAGENFDTNAVLGDRNGENGWYKAPGIRDGKYEMEYGGGVCQVSSTLYNAALMSCLEIVERTPHSWPIGYVPIGRDATISTGGPNLIIKNNTDSKITVSAQIDDEEQSITVRIYGRADADKDYARIDIESKQTGTIPAPKAEVVVDKSLSRGERVTDRKARDGKKALVERVYYDENDNEIRRETVSEDTYRAIAARILKGA